MVMAAAGCASSEPQTVPGPESKVLLPRIAGYVLTTKSSRQIVVIQLPTLKQSIIRPTRPNTPDDDPTIHSLSGPNDQGRIAFIEDHFFVANDSDRRHLLKSITLDGTQESELFSRKGDAMWAASAAGKGEIGQTLALSPSGGRVALVCGLSDIQLPQMLLQQGDIEVWNLGTKANRKLGIEAIDAGIAWFPDGKRLAYVKMVDRATVGAFPEKFGSLFRTFDRVPAVFVRDVDAETETFLHIGVLPVISRSGKTVIISDYETCSRVDVDSRQSKSATWPGLTWHGAFAMPSDEMVLSWCLPTAGAPVGETQNNSPLVGPKPMLSIKLTEFGSGDFQTIIPEIDPRHVISFGKGAETNVQGE